MQSGVGVQYFAIEIDGGATQCAVFRNLCAQHALHPCVYIFLQEWQQVFGRILFPSVDADFSVAHVGTKYHAVGPVFLQPLGEQLWMGNGNRADGNHLGSGAEGCIYILVALNTTSKVYC